MEALLASPSSFSPPASPNSSFPSSPRLPDLDSPFSNAVLDNWARESPNNTPTRQIATPAWITDELEEEWIEEDKQDEDDLTAEQEPFIDESCDSSNEETTKMNDSLYATPRTDSHSIIDDSIVHTRPRIPSSLRFSHSSDSQPTSQDQDSSSPTAKTVSSAGTFVFREGDSSVAYRDGEENQLQAAVKALRGPAGGLGGAPVAEGVEADVIATPVKTKKTADRLGGLLGLFEPPKSTIAPSSLPAPSSDTFDFTPPAPAPRTSWKALPHFSPTYASTPITVAPFIIADDDTPTCDAAVEAPAPKLKDRYLRSANLPPLAPSTPQSTTSSDRTPFPTTPAPQSELDRLDTPKSFSASEHRIFEFEYDTFTRDHLAALVEEIDGLGSGERTVEKTQVELDQAWETSFVELPPLEVAVGDDDMDDDAGRSSKRIRLSPPSNSIVLLSARQRRTASRAGMTAERAGIRVPSASGSYRRRQRDRSYDSSLASDAVSPTSSTQSFARSASHASIRSNVSTRFVDGRPATVGQPARTRDRLGEANALMDRIRARTVEQEKRIIDVNQRLDMDHDDEPTPTSTPRARSSGSMKPVSPRKLLRRLSSSLEIDAEFPQLSSKFSETGSESSRNHIEPSPEVEEENVTLPLLAAAASASIRNSLSPTKQYSATMLSPSTLFPQPLSPARRHFARTPLSTPSTRRNRTSSAAFDAPPGEEVWGTRKASEEVSVGTSSTNTLLATPGGHARISAITTIGPNDAEKLLSGTPSRMFFDKEQNKWIKISKSSANSLRDSAEVVEGEAEEGNSTEEDPFRDFDSLRISEEDTSNQSSSGLAALSRLSGLGITSSGRKVTPEVPVVVEVVEEISWEVREQYERDVVPLERVEEEVTADFDNSVEGGFDTEEETGDLERAQREESPFHLYQAMGAGEELVDATDEEEEDPTVRIATISILPPDIATPIALRQYSATSPTSSPSADPPTTPRSASLSPTLIPRSALKPVGRTQSAPALATPDRQSSFSSLRSTRSVSFSDGKTTGKMEGQLVQEFGRDGQMGSKLKFEIPVVGDGSGFSPVSNDALDQELEREFADDETISQVDASLEDSSIIIGPTMKRSASQSRSFRRTASGDATFLSECSFGVSHDRVLKVITDVQPDESDWEGLPTIDLAKKGVDTVVRLKEFLPNLVEADLAGNELAFLTGLPATMRTLYVSSNKLTSLASFAHLRHLERLDISNNDIDSVHQLSCLVHLRELKADYNSISDLGGLSEIDGLLKLSLEGNLIESIDFSATKWTRLESLNLSRNSITTIVELEHLQGLSMLNLDYNCLDRLEAGTTLPQLRVLRICSNPIDQLDIAFAPKLRTLFVDGAKLGQLVGTDQLRKLENLSVRDQSGAALTIAMNEIRDVKRLYLSGNPIPLSFPNERFYNLVYLELAMCQLESLPQDLAALLPNVRAINLNFNFISDLSPLIGLTRLKKVEAVGARLSKFRGLKEAVSSWPEIETVDFRMNPFTLPFYPPLVMQAEEAAPHSTYAILHPEDLPSAPTLSLAEGAKTASSSQASLWAKLDRKYRKSLPDTWYFKRTTYRAVMWHIAPTLVELDGIGCGEKERRKLMEMISGC